MAQPISTLEAQGSISELSSACSQLFDEYLQCHDATNNSIVEDLQDRFNLWTAYIGAFALPGASLDDRLLFHDEIRAMVMKLLDMLQRNLQSALEDDSTNPSANLPTHSSESLRVVSHLTLGSEAFRGLGAVSGALDRLHRLSTAIRRSSTSVRKEKLLAGLSPSDEDVYFQKSILGFIQGRFPAACPTLISHLLAALSFQRKRLIYQARHNLKLAQKRPIHQSLKQKPGSLLQQISARQIGLPGEIKVPHASAPSLVLSKTNASMPSSQRIRDAMVDQRKPTWSVTSTGSTAQGEVFQYPDPPPANGRKHVPCPYCAETIAASKLQMDKKVNVDFWRDHLNNDVEPYFCIADECREPLRFFVSFKDWIGHMRTLHSTEWSRSVYSAVWTCRTCSDAISSFSDANEFDLHLKTSHGGLTEIQKTARIKRSKSRALREPWICPLCECVPPKLSKIQNRDQDLEAHTLFGRHVGAHTKALSLLAFRFFPSTQESSADNEGSFDDKGSVEALLPNDDHPSTSKIYGATSTRSSIESTTFQDVPIDDRRHDEQHRRSSDGENVEASPPPLQNSGSWGFLPTFKGLNEENVPLQEPDAELEDVIEQKKEDPRVDNLEIPQRGSLVHPGEHASSDLSVEAHDQPVHIQVWEDGFTVGSGPLHLIHDGHNGEVVRSLDKGQAFSMTLVPADWPDIDSRIVITRHSRPYNTKQQSKGERASRVKLPYVAPSARRRKVPILRSIVETYEDRIQPAKPIFHDPDPNQIDDDSGSSTSVESSYGFESTSTGRRTISTARTKLDDEDTYQPAKQSQADHDQVIEDSGSSISAETYHRLERISQRVVRSGITTSVSSVLGTTLDVLGWIELEVYARHGDGEYLQSDFCLSVFRQIEEYLRLVLEQSTYEPNPFLAKDDNELHALLWDYLRFLDWIHDYFKSSESVHSPWLRRAPETFKFWCPLCAIEPFSRLAGYSDHMGTLHAGFPSYEPWLSLGRYTTRGPVTGAGGQGEHVTRTGENAVFGGKNLLNLFCDAFGSVCESEMSLKSSMEEMMTIDDVAELELRDVSTVHQ